MFRLISAANAGAQNFNSGGPGGGFGASSANAAGELKNSKLELM